MKIILLVLLLIPIFIFQAFIFVDAVSIIKVPERKSAQGSGTIRFNSERASKKSSLKVIR